MTGSAEEHLGERVVVRRARRRLGVVLGEAQPARSSTKKASSRDVGLGVAKPGSAATSRSSQSVRPNCARHAPGRPARPACALRERAQHDAATRSGATRYCVGREEARPQHGAERPVAEEQAPRRAAARRAAPASRPRASSVEQVVIRVDRVARASRHAGSRRGTRARRGRAQVTCRRRRTGLHRISAPAAGSCASRIARSAMCVTDPLEVVRRQRVDVHVRRRVHEVDRVGNAVAHRPLDRVHVVAERRAPA